VESIVPSKRGSLLELGARIPEMIQSGRILENTTAPRRDTKSIKSNAVVDDGKNDGQHNALSEGSSTVARAARIGKQYRHKVWGRIMEIHIGAERMSVRSPERSHHQFHQTFEWSKSC